MHMKEATPTFLDLVLRKRNQLFRTSSGSLHLVYFATDAITVCKL